MFLKTNKKKKKKKLYLKNNYGIYFKFNSIIIYFIHYKCITLLFFYKKRDNYVSPKVERSDNDSCNCLAFIYALVISSIFYYNCTINKYILLHKN